MNTIHIKCKRCGEIFDVNAPEKVGIYRIVCPLCKENTTFKVFPPYKPVGNSLPPKKAMTIKCPSCKAMFSAPLPSAPGSYGIACPSCRHEIRIKINP